MFLDTKFFFFQRVTFKNKDALPVVKPIFSTGTKLILPASEIHPFHSLPNPSWDLPGRLFEPCLCSWLPHGLCPFLLLLAWLIVGRSSQAVEVGGGLAPATAHYPTHTCWDSWCPGLSVLCLCWGLTKSLGESGWEYCPGPHLLVPCALTVPQTHLWNSSF